MPLQPVKANKLPAIIATLRIDKNSFFIFNLTLGREPVNISYYTIIITINQYVKEN